MLPIYTLLSAHRESPPPLIDLDNTVFVQFAIFLILLIVLQRFVFTPYLAIRRAQSDNIDGAKERAKKLDDRALSLTHEYNDKLLNTRKEAASQRATIRSASEHSGQQLVAVARAQADAKLKEARDKLEKTAPAVELALRARADKLARDIIEKVLGRAV